ncbi:MAG TPA: helix-hairpin-helix domain-containing protein, partial [Acidothermaceae bacterium]
LLRHFGSVKRVRAATVDELAEVDGIGAHTAQIVHAALAGDSSATPAGSSVKPPAKGTVTM